MAVARLQTTARFTPDRDLKVRGPPPGDHVAATLSMDAARKIEKAEAERARLRKALEDAIEMVEHWGGYASDYFRDKHDLAGDLSRLRAELHAGPDDA